MIAITDVERAHLESEGLDNVRVVPNVHVPAGRRGRRSSERDGLLFIGGYAHAPNVDAVEWLVHDIMPLVWDERADLTRHAARLEPRPARRRARRAIRAWW